jgi:hypothetical protein
MAGMQYDTPEPDDSDKATAPAQSQMTFQDDSETTSTTSSWIEATRRERAEDSGRTEPVARAQEVERVERDDHSTRAESAQSLAEAVPVYREPHEAAAPSAPARRATEPRVELPTVSLTLPPGSDLVLVETTHAAPAVEPEETEPTRPRRVRPARAQVASEPLQMVETRKDSPPAQ